MDATSGVRSQFVDQIAKGMRASSRLPFLSQRCSRSALQCGLRFVLRRQAP